MSIASVISSSADESPSPSANSEFLASSSSINWAAAKT